MIIYPKESNETYKNRGLAFESLINITNENYLKNNICLINKRPTPIKVIELDKNKNLITKATFLKQSTTDYNGLYKGKYIDFEAKSTHSKTSFPLKNIERHQINHLENVLNNNGIAFFLIQFSSLNEVYLLMTEKLLTFLKENKRSSLPLEYIKENGFLVKSSLKYPIDYISILEKIVNF